jgi:acetyl-CoA acetyltransferase
MASGIKDKVAILGMGCAKFGERWDCDADGLMVEAYLEALADAGIETSQIDAAWLSVAMDAINTGPGGIPASVALRLPNIPVTKVENYCASGTDAFRGAVYAVASGAADIALAIGVEKLKDTGYGGLPARGRGTTFDMVGVVGSAPGNFAQLAGPPRDLEGRPEARDGACLGQEPRQRREEPESSPEEAHRHRHRAERPDDRRAARAVRLLRRLGRRGLRHRDHPGDRARARQA